MGENRTAAYGLAAAVFALDRASKWFIETHVSSADTYRVIPGFFDIVHSQNRGVAFGLFDDSAGGWGTVALIVLSLVAVAVVNKDGVACSPCGACRQVIYEFGPEAIVIFKAKDGEITQMQAADLLPEGFRLRGK